MATKNDSEFCVNNKENISVNINQIWKNNNKKDSCFVFKNVFPIDNPPKERQNAIYLNDNACPSSTHELKKKKKNTTERRICSGPGK